MITSDTNTIKICILYIEIGQRSNKVYETSVMLLTGKHVCLLVFLNLAKGDDSINFDIRLMKCSDGKGTLSLTCTVQHLNVMKILKNGVEVSQCLTFLEYPYKYCEHSSPQDGNAKTNLHNCSMTYTIETTKTDLLPGTWACQNGGENDPSSNMKISMFNCILTTPSFSGEYCLLFREKLPVEDVQHKKYKQLNIFMNVSMIVVPLIAFCLTAIYRRQTANCV
ncbi:unnamed protein product [Mytilus edulis]|uniref:Uncharacterized protein n=1 Tax=Mytilus edulis TaxID=6550 RepID=A0A8S3SBD5_MYTED|nr:unnamed protein product [Mytilus edulis]